MRLHLECAEGIWVEVDPSSPEVELIEWMPNQWRFDPDATFDKLAVEPCKCCPDAGKPDHHHGVSANLMGNACRPLRMWKITDSGTIAGV